jgi:hypothetical protein
MRQNDILRAMIAALKRPWIVVLAAMVLAIAGLVAVNSVDEELRPEARALFRPAPIGFVSESGWALLVGFHAPAGHEPRRYGESLRKVGIARKAGVAATGELDVHAPSELLCLPEETDCTRAFAQRPESIADLSADNAVLLARYDELASSSRLTDVSEALDYYEPVPFFDVVMRTQRIRLSQVGAAVATGRIEPALAWLEKDAAFFRRWLDEAGSILTKMLALRGLARDLLVAGQAARHGRELTSAQWDRLDRIAAPLTPSQRAMGAVIRTEARLHAGILDQMLADSRATSKVLGSPPWMAAMLSATMRRDATLNFSYPLFDAWLRLDAVPTHELSAAIAKSEDEVRRHGSPDWTWAYNPTGKAAAVEATPLLTEYFYRLHDLDALASIVRCVVALRRAGVAKDAAQDFVASSPACRDPYESRPLTWDRERGELSFLPRSPRQVKRFGGAGGRVTFAAYSP